MSTTARSHPVVRQLHHDVNDRPHVVVWEVTRACQLACRHCRADAQPLPHPRQLTTAQGKDLLDDIAASGMPRPMVILSGGDAFERPDLAELIAHGTSRGLAMSLSPSVTPLLTDAKLAEVREAGVKAFSLSLDGATAATHDAFRGFPGTFDATLEAATLVRKHGFRFHVNTTITAGNVHEMPALLETVMGMGAHMWYLLFLVPMGRGTDMQPLDPDAMEDVLNWLHDVSDRVAVKVTEAPAYRRLALQREAARVDRTPMPTTGELHAQLTADTLARLGECTDRRVPRPPIGVDAGRGFAFIDHIGEVFPSGFLPLPCGSVHESPFSEIYRTSPTMQRLRRTAEFTGKCGTCQYNAICGGSRARTHAMTGDAFSSDPSCPFEPSLA
ncbi:TIGR04053 family radical SAM/SPASM domain-containing protein [Tessaracoccus antarcticus]|uniref:TIGR04053 family radical SAM/SPASM domain-containing protein n=1 Tax=Tessaracoccus antarcticus TaxID=2479848 RepID=A0A3M0GAY4_9ACTN|nr:TIGR04053 family radical SAM/SPASM domain-containing protein [Tessaracoccus antarcticus]RMB61588.1 TIGR04053 family radical SAM/SPASM domain-containing protein [Tessaracoccus antarcticus]